jgi:16S rRNA (adenine(1408)-N(1))-methyltransferase
VLSEARARPEAFFIGIDAVADAMAEASRRAAAKPARGGVANAMFVCAAAETMPGMLAGMADEISVNYPWGSLLRAVAMPDVGVLTRIARLGKPGAKFTAVINVQPLRDSVQAERLGMADAMLLRDVPALRGAYARAGLDVKHVREVAEDALPATSWGRHLAVSKQEVWTIEARA